MSTILPFLGIAVLLQLMGCLTARLLLPGAGRGIQCSLAFPLAVLANVLLVFALTVLSIPLKPWSFLIAYLLSLSVLFTLYWKHSSHRLPNPNPNPLSIGQKIVMGACLLLLLNIFLYAAVHALVLPSLAVDSFTNWAMRAKLSFLDQSIAFDPTELRGMAKPQYPFLLHALQIAVNYGQAVWSDRLANTGTFFLSLSSFAAAFFLLRRLRGTLLALVTVTLIAGMPLLSVHLAQGYGDVHLIQYLMLAFLTLALWIEEGERRWLLVSSLMIAAALWTKLEGVWFGFVPWAVCVMVRCPERSRGASNHDGNHGASPGHPSRAGCAGHLRMTCIPILLFIPFILLILWKGLPLTPHDSDMRIAWHPEALRPLLSALFAFNSFGILWYVLPPASVIMFRRADARHRALFVWSGIVLAQILMMYIVTPNAEGLVNGQGFFRQALVPGVLGVLACAVCWRGSAGDRIVVP